MGVVGSFGYKRSQHYCVTMQTAHSPGSYLDTPREMQLLVQFLALQLNRMPGDLAAELGDRVQELADHLETGRGVKQRAHATQKHRVVVGEQDANRFHVMPQCHASMSSLDVMP